MNGQQLKQAFAALPELTGEAPDYTWHKHRRMIREHVAQTTDPNTMLQWSTIVATMFVGTGAVFTPIELTRLTNRYKEIIREPWVGSPEPYNGWTSGNLIHQAYHLMQWERATRVNVEDLQGIVEIGGGYGAMALLCIRLGFRGRYVIIDYPELQLLQDYYLSNCGVTGMEWANLDELPKETDLLVALYSITEMEVADRWQILNGIQAKHLLLCYQPTFTPFKETVDNRAWAVEVMESLGRRCLSLDVDLPMLDGHQYLLR